MHQAPYVPGDGMLASFGSPCVQSGEKPSSLFCCVPVYF